MTLKRMTTQFCIVSKMNKIDRTNLTDQTKFRLNEISKIKNYFIDEINQRKSCSKKLSKYVAAFDNIDKILNILSIKSGDYLFVCLRALLEHQLEYQAQVLL